MVCWTRASTKQPPLWEESGPRLSFAIVIDSLSALATAPSTKRWHVLQASRNPLLFMSQ